jgi:hypothetical protein
MVNVLGDKDDLCVASFRTLHKNIIKYGFPFYNKILKIFLENKIFIYDYLGLYFWNPTIRCLLYIDIKDSNDMVFSVGFCKCNIYVD